MRTRGWFAAGLVAAALAVMPTHVAAGGAAPADRILGYWLVDTRDAIVQIQAAGSGAARRYEGRLVWLKQSRYSEEDGADLAGKLILDSNNSDPGLRDRPLLGLKMLWGLRYDADDRQWHAGRIYNSDNGHTYQCLVWLKDAKHLVLRGYVGMPVFGGSTTWTRVHGPQPPPG
ncbi:MAG: DUF2147 domain-containing protein [Gammaproteobacteria bacterium]|nr:DUF2147 domain-containing protein [Gammaproteobacteria bacterium]